MKYPDGQVYGWIYWNLRPDVALAHAGAPAQGGKSLDPAVTATAPLPTILRPGPSTHTLVYRAGPLGHVVLTASVNGAPVRFLVDTGASTVALSAADARAVGINPSALVFDRTTTTANGVVRVAPVLLREIRIEQLSVENVPAVVDANLSGSLLGMSFLSRLKSFEMREGALILNERTVVRREAVALRVELPGNRVADHVHARGHSRIARRPLGDEGVEPRQVALKRRERSRPRGARMPARPWRRSLSIAAPVSHGR